MGTLIGEHELVGRILPVRSTFGSEVFEEARQMSSSLQEYCGSNGDPDYIMLERPGAWVLFTLLYPHKDRAVYFRDVNPLSPTARFGSVIEESPMPRWLWGRMSNSDQAVAEARRQRSVERPLYGHWRDTYEE